VYKQILTAALLILLSSCAQKQIYPGLPETSPEELLRKAALLQNSVRSVKGLASVSIKTRHDKISYTQVTLAEEPDLLRLEALNPFGSTVGFISSDGKKIYIVSQKDRGVYDIEEVFDLSYVYPGIELEITIERLVDLVTGRVPKDLFTGEKEVHAASSPEGITLTFGNIESDASDKLWINPANNRVEKARILLESGEVANLNYEYFDDLINGHYFPRLIEFKTGELAITIKYEPDVVLNKAIDSLLLKPPPGS
jgi:outer membrane lipoprotein-sorting protein